MSHNRLVRASRDGDQFHYLWAARRCLKLLSPLSGLVGVAIEGVSPSETPEADPVTSGEDVIDVTEYFGSEDLNQATLIRHLQLKHSTERASEPWTLSGLENTLEGFARRYAELRERFAEHDLAGRLEFWFVSNRPIASGLIEAVSDAANGRRARHPLVLRRLKKIVALTTRSQLAAFCMLLRLEGKQDDYWDQRNLLFEDLGHYLPGADVDAPKQLKELVTRKALSESEGKPTIRKMDVLRALQTDVDQLFPAPCLIPEIASVIPREQEPELIAKIIGAAGIPVILHAAGGVGKSVFSKRINLGLPDGSFSITYDCFGNGQYRSPTRYRHRDKDALVQIANELAAAGICHPLIPNPQADHAAYLRAFMHRLGQSVASLRAANPHALLCIVVDAADNSQMAANEANEPWSFIRDLLRESMPEGLRLIAFCRTERVGLLDPPPMALRLELLPFTRSETAANLRHVFPTADDNDVDEFHRLSSQNPRVQARALLQNGSLHEILRMLGPQPTTVDGILKSLLDKAIVNLRDRAGSVEKGQIDRICAGLAVLRPLIPISVLSSIAEVDASAIKSFVFDIGRPLVVNDETVQFFDEPAETWFRDHFRPKNSDLETFVAKLQPLAGSSAYIAAALPLIMLEAGLFDELVALALSSRGLPEANPLERRDVELQRLQFALKASLRAKRYTDAAKLALKAGGETAGDERQQKLLRDNTDLAAVFVDSASVQETVSRGVIRSGWMGSHHVYEAGMMSGKPELAGDARSRLRLASEWLKNWNGLSDREKEQEPIADDDIAEIAMTHFNLHGAVDCAENLRRWNPRDISFRAGRIVARRFVDSGRFQDLEDLCIAAESDAHLILAVTLQLREVHRVPPRICLERLRPTLAARSPIRSRSLLGEDETTLRGVVAFVEACHKLSVCPSEDLVAILTRYLPDAPNRGHYSRYGKLRFPILRAYSLRAVLAGHSLELNELADPELRKELEANRETYGSRDREEFKQNIGALLPWHLLWAETFLGVVSVEGVATAIDQARKASSSAASVNYLNDTHTSDEIAGIWLDILIEAGSIDPASINGLNQWIDSLRRPQYTPTLDRLARLAARTAGLEAPALAWARKSFKRTKDARESAESKVESYVNLARAILTVSKPEAAEYFNEAVRVASKIGDENLARWSAILYLADRAGCPNRLATEAAYKLARSAELTHTYEAGDNFDWKGTVRAIAGLCPPSSLAILSRWRDRRFGWAEQLLPLAISYLSEYRNLDPKSALALVGFRARWNTVQLLGNALAACTSKSEKETAAAFFCQFIRLDQHRAKTWQSLKNVLVSHGLATTAIDESVSFSEHADPLEKADNYSGDHYPVRQTNHEGPDWDTVFAGVDPGKANDITLAYQRYKSLPAPYYHELFFGEACRRVKVGEEARLAAAFGDVVDFELYHFRVFLEQIPDGWKDSLSVKTAFVGTLRKVCRRHCMEISRSRHYERFPFKRASQLAGVTESEIVDMVLSAAGEITDLFDASRLFPPCQHD